MLEKICQDLQTRFPLSKCEIEDFPSGAATLDVRFMDSHFVVEHYADDKFVVYESCDEPFCAPSLVIKHSGGEAKKVLFRIISAKQIEMAGVKQVEMIAA